MESPFFSNYWNSCRPRYSPTTRGKPVHHQKTKSPSPSPNVISIPVHFVGSEKTRSASALKIQKVFRGFLVRKSLKKIVGIGNEVEEIERRISERELVDLIRRDAKERLKVNEMLMALLIRLDSVSGVDSGVRSCRKAVIRKAIALQEIVDAIVTGDQSLDVSDGKETKDQTLDIDGNGDSSGSYETVDQALEIKDPASSSDNCRTKDNAVNRTLNSGQPDAMLEAKDQTLQEVLDPVVPLLNSDDQTLESQLFDSTGNCDTPAENAENSGNLIEGGEEETEEKQDGMMEIQEAGRNQENPTSRGKENNRDVMEENENEKLMGLMREMLERNTLQSRLISSLSQRVEQLERAFRSEKKKRHAAAGIVHGSSKCGRKS